MKTKRRAAAVTAIATGLILAAGCGGGGGGGGHTRTAQFSAANTEQAMVFMGDTMVACQDGTFVKAPQASAARAVGFARTLPRQLFAFGSLKNWDDSDSAGGDCTDNVPGSVSVNFDHSSGSTTFSFTFSNYCKRDGTNDRETIFNGTAWARQNGTPGDFGPTYKGLDAKTTGSGIAASTYDTSGVTRVGPTAGPVGVLMTSVDIDIAGYSIDFGKPATFNPDAPDAANPDIDTISSLTVRNTVTGDVTRIEDVRVESYELTADTSNVEITSGWVSNSEVGTFSIATGEGAPLVVASDGEVISGAVVATGAKNTTVTITADSSLFTAEVFDGTDTTVIDTGVQCYYTTRWPAGLLGFYEEE